jgi:ZIP family zinc transporter
MLTAILLSLLAGLATGLGGLMVVSMKKVSRRGLGFGLGFSSGIMIIIGIHDLFGKSIELGDYNMAVASFIAGALFIIAIDALVPHEFFFRENGVKGKNFCLMKIGMITAFGITIHNIPEGMIVGAGYAAMPAFGLALAIAIALHNIPEGVAVSMPLRACGWNRRKVVYVSFLSGLAEPLGAVIAVAFLSFIPGILPLLLGFAGGVMTYLTMDELIPTAQKYGSPHAIGAGLIAGLIMALLIGQLV